MKLQTSNFLLRRPLQPKARPRFSKGRAYTDGKYREWMEHTRSVLSEWWTIAPLRKGQVVLLSVIFRGPGVSDLDNLLGAILDAGIGILWCDDRVTVIHRIDMAWVSAPRDDQSIKLTLVWKP